MSNVSQTAKASVTKRASMPIVQSYRTLRLPTQVVTKQKFRMAQPSTRYLSCGKKRQVNAWVGATSPEVQLIRLQLDNRLESLGFSRADSIAVYLIRIRCSCRYIAVLYKTDGNGKRIGKLVFTLGNANK